MIVIKKILKYLKKSDKEFSKFLFKISRKSLLAGIENKNGYLSIGDKKRLSLTRSFFLNNDTLIIDRDGVLNELPKKESILQI